MALDLNLILQFLEIIEMVSKTLVSGNAKPVKEEVIVTDEEPVVNSIPKTRKRSNNAVPNSSNSKNVKVKKEEPHHQDNHSPMVKKEESGDPDKPGFSMELKSHAALGLRNALRSIRVPEIFRCCLEAKPSQLQIQIKNQNGGSRALLTLKPTACTVFNCTQSYILGLEFDRLLAAICNPAQDDQSIIRLSIGDRKLPLIIQSGTNSTTFKVEVQLSESIPCANKPVVYGTIFLSSGFFNSILHSMEEMVAYKSSLGTQLDINNMGIDIKITSKAVKIVAVGVGYHLNPQEGHCRMLRVENKRFNVSFPVNELTNYIQASKTAENVTLYVHNKFLPQLCFSSSTASVLFFGKIIPSAGGTSKSKPKIIPSMGETSESKPKTIPSVVGTSESKSK